MRLRPLLIGRTASQLADDASLASPSPCSASLVLAALGTFLYTLTVTLVRPRTTSLRELPGPGRGSFWYGQVPKILSDPPGVPHCEWHEQFGGAVQYAGFFGVRRPLFLLLDATPTSSAGRAFVLGVATRRWTRQRLVDSRGKRA